MPPAVESSAPAIGRRSLWAWAAVAALVIANVPLMLCMPLPADAALYDLQAKTALSGGVLYRDIVEPNLPGIVWCHMAIRSLFGWSEVALKWVDLVVVGAITWLLVRLVARRRTADGFESEAGSAVLAGLAFVIIGFYCSTPEWVHCQRDIWLTLPALLAFTLRTQRSVADAANVGQPTALSPIALQVLEGTLWGCAFWIKPYVAVPAAFAVALSLLLMRRRGATWRRLTADVLCVVAGGALTAAAGSAWLVATGTWQPFLEQMLEWNPVYFANGRSRWTLSQYVSLSRDLAPWCLVHIVALPVAAMIVWRTMRTSWRVRPQPDVANHAPDHISALLAALYLGWMLQAHFLQHPFHYCHTPTVFLAAAVLATQWPAPRASRRIANLAFAASIVVAFIQAPCFAPARLAWWSDCITRGAKADVKCALHHRNLPNWVELQPVIEFLRDQNLKDGELTAYNVFLVHLYPEVGVMPSTRYVFLDVLMQVFHDRSDAIQAALADSPQRFVVCSLLENGMSADDIAAAGPGVQETLPPAFPAEHASEFPYCLPLVFRSGQYVVYRVDRDLGQLNTTPRPLARN
ncbi:MAG TPA: hypothetical protein VM452_11520 [Caulifigura sp.]|nr:hypothetical protein [Caulifigura sp.]